MAEEVQIKTTLDNQQAIGGLVNLEKKVQDSGKSIDNMSKSTQTFQQQMKALNKELSTITLDEQISKVNKIFQETPKSVKTLTAEIEQYTSIAIRAGRETPIGREFLKKAADARDQLADVTNEVNRLAQDGQKLQGAIQGIGVAAGAFAIAQSGAALFGEENEELQKQIVKVTAAMNVLQGVERIRASLEKESALRLQLVNALEKIRSLELFKTTAATTAATASTVAANSAQKAFAVTTLFSNKALKAFKLALIGTGIGAIVVAIGLLIANFDEVKKVVTDTTGVFGTIAVQIENIKMGLQALGVIQSAEAERLQTIATLQIENLKKQEDAVKNRFDFEIGKASAAGKNTFELEKLKRAETIKSLKAQADAILSLVKLSGEFNDDQKTRLQELSDLTRKLSQDNVVAEIKNNKKLSDEEVKEADKRKQAREKAAKEKEAKDKEEAQKLIAIAAELETLRIASIEDSTAQELAKIDQKFNARITKLKEGGEKEVALAVALEQEKARQIAVVEENTRKEKEEKEKAAEDLRRQNKELLAQTEIDIQTAKAQTEIEELEAKKEADKLAEQEEFDNKLLLLEERGLLTQELEAEIEAARLQSLANINAEFDEAKQLKEEELKNNNIARAQEERNAKITIAATTANALTSISGSLEAMGVKNAGLQKTLAIAQIAIDTAKGISAAVASGSAMPFPANIPAIITGVAAVISGIASAKAALSKAKTPAGGGGGGSVSLPSAGQAISQALSNAQGQAGAVLPGIPAATPSALGAGGTVLSDAQAAGSNQTVKAFVVETEITDSQAAAQLIDEKAELT